MVYAGPRNHIMHAHPGVVPPQPLAPIFTGHHVVQPEYFPVPDPEDLHLPPPPPPYSGRQPGFGPTQPATAPAGHVPSAMRNDDAPNRGSMDVEMSDNDRGADFIDVDIPATPPPPYSRLAPETVRLPQNAQAHLSGAGGQPSRAPPDAPRGPRAASRTLLTSTADIASQPPPPNAPQGPRAATRASASHGNVSQSVPHEAPTTSPRGNDFQDPPPNVLLRPRGHVAQDTPPFGLRQAHRQRGTHVYERYRHDILKLHAHEPQYHWPREVLPPPLMDRQGQEEAIQEANHMAYQFVLRDYLAWRRDFPLPDWIVGEQPDPEDVVRHGFILQYLANLPEEFPPPREHSISESHRPPRRHRRPSAESAAARESATAGESAAAETQPPLFEDDVPEIAMPRPAVLRPVAPEIATNEPAMRAKPMPRTRAGPGSLWPRLPVTATPRPPLPRVATPPPATSEPDLYGRESPEPNLYDRDSPEPDSYGYASPESAPRFRGRQSLRTVPAEAGPSEAGTLDYAPSVTASEPPLGRSSSYFDQEDLSASFVSAPPTRSARTRSARTQSAPPRSAPSDEAGPSTQTPSTAAAGPANDSSTEGESAEQGTHRRTRRGRRGRGRKNKQPAESTRADDQDEDGSAANE